jgi:hypothetical protein
VGSPNVTCEQRWAAQFWRVTQEVLDVSSANRKRALSSALFRRVEVPLALK